MFTSLLKRYSMYSGIMFFILFLQTSTNNVSAATSTINTELYLTVQGTITDQETGVPIPGVTVRVPGTKIGAVTDFDGNYQIEVPDEYNTLVASYVGYETQEIAIDGRSIINIQMEVDLQSLEEVILTGYSTEKAVDVTGAVSVVETETLENKASNNPIQSLQGEVPGVFITTNGSPSGGDTQVRIRGASTLNNNDPLYVIDGVPTTSSAFEILNPNDIESIQVLKDAASSAIYGARASNGVILITTKRATGQGTKISYTSSFTHSSYNSKPSVLTTEQRARVQWQATVNDGLDPDNIPIIEYDWERNADGTAVLNDITIPEYIVDGVPTANTNWFDVISRNGFTQEHNLSLSTASENGGSFMSLRYFDNQYLLEYRNFEKVSARINSHYNLLDGKIKIGENLVISNGKDNGSSSTQPLTRALEVRPILPVRTEDGGYSGPVSGSFVDGQNPLMILDYNQWDQRETLNIFGNVYANASLLENLTLNASLGVDLSNYHSRDIQRRFSTGFISRPSNSLQNFKSEMLNWNLNSTIQYTLQANNHSATFLAGAEAIKYNYEDNFTYKEDFAVETLNYFVESAGSGAQNIGGTSNGYALLSYFGKANYSFDEKYLASATVRYDGSSRFGSNNRWGVFPSFTAGWRLSEEDFISDNVPTISALKLRASWGKVGNQSIPNIARYTVYRTFYGQPSIAWASNYGTAYDISGADTGTLPSGFRRIQTGNEDLKWEETTEINVGVDFGFLDNRITGSIDYFTRTTEDILISPDFIAVRGEGGNRFVNGATVEIDGAEGFLRYRGTFESFNFSVTGNLSHYKDEIIELPSDVIRSYPGNAEQTILGESMHSHFGYVADGLFQTQQEVVEHAEQPGKGLGRIRYADLNGDGVINPLDQKFLGTSAPSFIYGLNLEADYENFDLRVFLQGVQGVVVYNSFKSRTDFTGLWAGTNYGTRTLDAWTPTNSDSTIPAVTLTDNNNEGRLSTYWLDNGSYLKLRQASLGYTLNDILGSREMRLSLTGENLMTLKDNSGANAFTSPDPENPGQSFPRPLRLTVGINLIF